MSDYRHSRYPDWLLTILFWFIILGILGHLIKAIFF